MSGRFAATARLPRSGNAALATGALVQAAIGAEFVLAGLSKAVDAEFTSQFRSFVQASPGTKMGLLVPLMQGLVVPNAELMAQFAKWTELLGGLILVVVAVEVLRRRLAEPFGAQHAYEPIVAMLSSVAAFALGGMSLTIYLLEGGPLPTVSAGFAFTSPVPIELFLVPLALSVAWLEFARFRALR
jgi:hypothetical protein